MERGKRRKIASFVDPGGPRAPLRSNLDDPEGWDTSGSEEECVQRDVVHRMAPVANRPIIKCSISGCSGSFPLFMVENGYKAGKKPATCRTCGKIFPRPNISGIKSRSASPTRSQKSSVSSWSEALCEQSRNQVVTVLPAAIGPCAPSEPVPFSSGFVFTSEHAAISGLSAGSFVPVLGISRGVCAVTHGFGGVLNPMWARSTHLLVILIVELVSRATYISRKKRNLETVQRHSKALKKAQRDAEVRCTT